MRADQLKAQIEQIFPAAFTVYPRQKRGTIPTGIPQIDAATGGIPLHSLTEICGSTQGPPDRAPFAGWGSSLVSSGKTSVLISLLAHATRDHFCALVDATDNFDPASAHAAGVTLPRLLWVRCGKNRAPFRGAPESMVKLPPLEQAFKVADILLQSGGFRLISVDLSGIPERVVRKVQLSTWFRFSRVIERQPAALVFLEQEPHAASCAGLVLRVASDAPLLKGHLFTRPDLNVEIVRSLEKKPANSERRASEPNVPFLPKPEPQNSVRRENKKICSSDFSPCLGVSVVDSLSAGQSS